MAERRYRNHPPSTSSSGTSTPSNNLSSSWNLGAVSGLLRRFSTEPFKTPTPIKTSSFTPTSHSGKDSYSPYRTASPFQPPPLYPVILDAGTDGTSRLLSRALAEEIRLLVPARLQLCEEWNLVYSLERDGVSLGTLYKNCEEARGRRNGFVLVVKDGEGGVSSF